MKISSIFGPTIQGEGKSTGKKVMFVRLALCNLHCIWCDTPYTWNWEGSNFAHPLKFKKADEIKEITIDEIIGQLESSNLKAVVISGGEPLLQQKELVNLVRQLKQLGYWVEIETNATINPTQEMIDLIDQFNCSPKLANSGDNEKLRIRIQTLTTLAQCGKANFKFVVNGDEDVEQILALVNQFKMQEVYLMPQGLTKEELVEKEDKVKDLCVKYNFNFCQRIHIIELGGGRYI